MNVLPKMLRCVPTVRVTAARYMSSMMMPRFVPAPEDSLQLGEFLDFLPAAIRQLRDGGVTRGSRHDLVSDLLQRLELKKEEWIHFCHFDPSRNYTRNLMSTDHETYSLLLLCWNPGATTPIHDHPGDGCWMRLLAGQVHERRYKEAAAGGYGDDGSLICVEETTLEPGGVAFISDSMGYHSLGNSCSVRPAVTMHLYSPPIQTCRVWLEQRGKPSMASLNYYTEFGDRV